MRTFGTYGAACQAPARHPDPCQRDHPTFGRPLRQDAGVATGARLDRPALFRWCLERLGWQPQQVLFETGYLSQVIGLRLANGQDVVVKVRAWRERLVACGQVQQSLLMSGFPAPQLLVAPERLGQLGVSAEPSSIAASCWRRERIRRLALPTPCLGSCAPRLTLPRLAGLAPSRAWVGWDHAGGELWPDPDDRDGDLNTHPGDRWLDETGAAAREQLLAVDQPVMVGHGDWYSQNLRWVDKRLHVVHDWDSVVA